MIRRLVLPALGILLLLFGLAQSFSTAADATGKKLPLSPAPSTFAPADDLIAQTNFYLQRTGETLASKSDFVDAGKSRLKKDAETLAVLFLVLGMHDTENRFKKAGPALVKQAQALANATDYDAAAAAYSELKKLASDGGVVSSAEPLKWQKVASLDQLMKQVPSINSVLRRAVAADAGKFKELEQQSAANSATLGAIAQAVMVDTYDAKNAAQAEQWYRYCAEMRDAAGAVNAAVHVGNQEGATAAMTKLATSCRDCHDVFRKE